MDLVAWRGMVRRSCLSAYCDINPPTPSVAERVGKNQRRASDILVIPKRKIPSARSRVRLGNPQPGPKMPVLNKFCFVVPRNLFMCTLVQWLPVFQRGSSKRNEQTHTGRCTAHFVLRWPANLPGLHPGLAECRGAGRGRSVGGRSMVKGLGP